MLEVAVLLVAVPMVGTSVVFCDCSKPSDIIRDGLAATEDLSVQRTGRVLALISTTLEGASGDLLGIRVLSPGIVAIIVCACVACVVSANAGGGKDVALVGDLFSGGGTTIVDIASGGRRAMNVVLADFDEVDVVLAVRDVVVVLEYKVVLVTISPGGGRLLDIIFDGRTRVLGGGDLSVLIAVPGGPGGPGGQGNPFLFPSSPGGPFLLPPGPWPFPFPFPSSFLSLSASPSLSGSFW